MSETAPEILIFTSARTPRMAYVFEVLFGILYPKKYLLIHEEQEYRQFPGVKLNYSPAPLLEPDREIWIPSGEILNQQQIKPIQPVLCSPSTLSRPGEAPPWPALFPIAVAHPTPFPFDLPGMCFYLLSRYEEYLDFVPDRFGRFSAGQSEQARLGILEYPLVDYWARELVLQIKKIWPAVPFTERTYRFLPTYDIDMAWAYLYRPLWRHLSSMLRDLMKGKARRLLMRAFVWGKRDKDPFDVYDFLDSQHRKRGLSPFYFFLLGNYAKFDPNISYRNTAFQELIRRLAQSAPVGLHPSMASNQIPGRLEKEKDRLEKILQRAVFESRQHYLVFNLPESYRKLIQAGIVRDFSMGYADAPGFRAGISCPFPWYDLKEEKTTRLWVHPFHVMDGTLRQYLKLNPSEAVEKANLLIERCRQVGGEFSTLWHNSSFYDHDGWEGWKEVYLQILDKAVEIHPAPFFPNA